MKVNKLLTKSLTKRTIQHPNNKQNQPAQMIVLMGVVLAISVFIIASIPSQIVNMEGEISREQATSLFSEFIQVKEVFGQSLNYNLADIDVDSNPITFYGSIDELEEAFQKTKDSLYLIEINHALIFDADHQTNWYWFSHESEDGKVYTAQVLLTLDDGETQISEYAEYSIICNEEEIFLGR